MAYIYSIELDAIKLCLTCQIYVFADELYLPRSVSNLNKNKLASRCLLIPELN